MAKKEPLSRAEWIKQYMEKNNVNRNTAQSAWRQAESKQALARAAKAKYNARPDVKVTKAVDKFMRSGAGKTVGKIAKGAGAASAVAGMASAAYQLSTKEGLKNAAASRKAVMEAAAGKGAGAQATNRFTQASTNLAAAKKAAMKKAAANAAKRIPADQKDSSRKNVVGARRSADSADSSRTPKPMKKTSQNGSTGLTGASKGVYTVKSGDNLWNIARANKTTVSAILKANPIIAKRREAGKVDIFSGSKVRIPKGKK